MSARIVIVLLLILALALVLRLHGITWGLPDDAHLFSYHPDEYFSLMAVWSFCFAGGDLNPHYFNYGTLYFYLVLIVAILAGHTDFDLQTVLDRGVSPPMRALVLDGRLTTVVLAVLTVLFVFLAARRLFGVRAGLIGAFTLAIMPLHVVHGRFATVDVPMTFWIVVCLYCSACILAAWRPGVEADAGRGTAQSDLSAPRERRRVLLLCAAAGGAAGLAAATKYNGGLSLVFPVVAVLLGKARLRGAQRTLRCCRCLAACAGAAALGFVLGCPYALAAPREWWGSVETFQGVSYELHHMRAGEHPAVEAWPNGFAFHLAGSLSYGLGVPLLAVLLASVAYACYRRTDGDWLILPFLVVWYLMIGVAKVRYMRYAMPLLPMLAILGGRMTADVRLSAGSQPRKARLRVAAGIVTLAVIAYADMTALAHVLAYGARRFSREDVLKASAIAPGDSVGLIWAPWFCHPPVAYVNGGQVLNRHPIWRTLARSPYDVRVVGYSPDEADLPGYMIVTSFELRDVRRAQTAEWRSMERILGEHYTLVAREPPPPRPPVWFLGRPLSRAPADWLYPFPGIEVYRLRSEDREGLRRSPGKS